MTPLMVPVCVHQAATLFAVMKDTDYAAKPVFVENFFKCFRQVLKGQNKETITEFSKCDFTNIYNWNVAEREKKKALTTEVRRVKGFWQLRAATELTGLCSCRTRRRSRPTETPRRSRTRRAPWTAE